MLVAFCSLFLIVYILPKILPEDHPLRYYLCYFIFILLSLLTSTILLPLQLLKPKNLSNLWYATHPAAIVSNLIGIKWEIRNSEILSGQEKGVIILNHQSMLDVLGILHIWDIIKDCVIIARKEVFYVWPFGLSLWLCGAVFIERGNPKLAVRELRSGILFHIKYNSNTKVLIFPEGTRNKGKGMLPFKKGAFKTALEHQIPILPVVFSPYYFIKENSYFTSGKMIVSFLDPIPTKGMSDADIQNLTDKSRTAVLQEYEKLCKEVEINKIY